MYSSSYIVQTFLSLLLFQVQHIATAKDDLGLIRLQAQKRTFADSPLPETLFLWENHLTPEEISNKDLAPTSGDILMDESGSMRDQNQQLWFQQDPVKLLLTDCTTTGTTEHSDQSSLLPSAKFQRRQFQDPNACPVPGNNQPDQLKLQQGEQGQEGRRGPTMPDNTRPDEGQAGGEAKLGDSLTPKVEHYPSSLELSNLFQFGRKGDPQEICNALVGQGTPMCAPVQIPPLVSPAEVVVPGRFCKSAFVLIEFGLRKFFFSMFLFFFAMRGRAEKAVDSKVNLFSQSLARRLAHILFFLFPGYRSFFLLPFFCLFCGEKNEKEEKFETRGGEASANWFFGK